MASKAQPTVSKLVGGAEYVYSDAGLATQLLYIRKCPCLDGKARRVTMATRAGLDGWFTCYVTVNGGYKQYGYLRPEVSGFVFVPDRR